MSTPSGTDWKKEDEDSPLCSLGTLGLRRGACDEDGLGWGDAASDIFQRENSTITMRKASWVNVRESVLGVCEGGVEVGLVGVHEQSKFNTELTQTFKTSSCYCREVRV